MARVEAPDSTVPILSEQAPEQQGDAGVSTHTSSRASHEPVRAFALTATRGPNAGVKFTSKGARVVVGTHESADLVLNDQTVSRFHCDLIADQGRVLLRDLGSTNGTIANGMSIVQAHLVAATVLRIGDTELRFEPLPQELKIPLSQKERFGILVGRSVAMRRVFAVFERIAESDATVLIEGETGTGKEAAAESIHRESGRGNGLFVVVDCAAIPANLLESELFGHERGAFTGAGTAREGAFEAAAGGTLFLDEVGELSLDLQPKLLRVLERKEVKRVGGNRYVPVDVRIVAATNRNLKKEVNERRFRPDLYYRLAVVEARLPSLRERADDLPLLLEELLARLTDPGAPEAEPLRTVEFLADLAQHTWPGNVRELRNYVERCLAFRERVPLSDDAPPESTVPDVAQPFKIARERWTRSFERRYLQEILRRHEDNVTAAARGAGLDRMYFYRLLWRHGLR